MGMRMRRAAAMLLTLIALMAAISAAAGEAAGKTWEERMKQARKRYNEKTVNVFIEGHDRVRKNKINVMFYRLEETNAKGRPLFAFNIRESLEITDEAEIQAVLEVVAKHEKYSEERFGSIAFMKAVWIAHNLAHSMAGGSEEAQRLVEAIMGENISDIADRAKLLDINPIETLPEQELALYRIIEMIYQTDKDSSVSP